MFGNGRLWSKRQKILYCLRHKPHIANQKHRKTDYVVVESLERSLDRKMNLRFLIVSRDQIMYLRYKLYWNI